MLGIRIEILLYYSFLVYLSTKLVNLIVLYLSVKLVTNQTSQQISETDGSEESTFIDAKANVVSRLWKVLR